MKYVAFDVGDVLCYCNENKFINAVSESANITKEETYRFFKRFWELHDLGFTTIEDELQDKLGIKSEITLKKLTDAWLDTLQTDDIVIKYLRNLMFKEEKKTGCYTIDVRTEVQVALLSNIGKEHATILKDRMDKHYYNSFGIFDNCIRHFSCEVGARKPSFIYYQSFLAMHPKFKGCIYVDDKLENLKAAEKLGFQPFHFSLKDFYEDGYFIHYKESELKNKLKQLEKLILA